MARTPVTVHLPGNSSFRTTRSAAAELVRGDRAVYIDERCNHVMLKRQSDAATRGLSCRVGAALATAYREREAWAVIAVEQILHRDKFAAATVSDDSSPVLPYDIAA